MDDVATVHNENENLKRVRARLLQWEAKKNPLASLPTEQEEYLEVLTNAWRDDTDETLAGQENENTLSDVVGNDFAANIKLPKAGIDTTNDFLLWYDRVHEEIHEHGDVAYHRYLQQLELRSEECCRMLDQISVAVDRLNTLSSEYEFVSQKTSALNNASEKLIDEQQKLQELSDEIQRRLHYFNQVELLHQRLQSPTLSVASEAFKECLNRIDECLEYLRDNANFKDSAGYTMKYKLCLSKAVTLIKTYCANIMAQATEATLHPKQSNASSSSNNASSDSTGMGVGSATADATFALYYGKYQTSAAKIKRIAMLIEPRIDSFQEYEQLLIELQQNYMQQRASIMSPAVDQAIKDIRAAHKGDHCSLMRSTCAFLVHVCQDEQRLYYQFFSIGSEQLTIYLEGLCNILYDTMRPYIIHINHLETLAEICSILRIEMLEEHVQQNPEALEAFATIANQLLQDVQERLVFRAHLYLNSDILNYNPSTGDLAYPEKLEMMESIAMSLQEPQHLRRFDSKSSLISTASSAIETESVDTAYRGRNMNSPADLHGMWYPTVRRTLVCLSRLYRCVDRPIFQGLSQEALKLCIQSVSAAATKIAAAKSPIDGELFEIKHLLILREQIAPFRVDFTVKETSLDFSKVKTAAFGLLHKRKQLFSMGSNNALLEFLLEGTPQIKEHLLDSRKEVDRQLKMACEQFIKDAAQMLVGPITTFTDKAQTLLATNSTQKDANKVNYILRQTQWASPQHISSVIQETQRLIKGKLTRLQRSMQLYLSNRDTEFIIFRPIRNNIIQAFVKLEQLLITNGYTADDMIIAGCPTAEQVSIMLSSASILAAEGIVNFNATTRKYSTSSSNDGATSTTPTVTARKFNFDNKIALDPSVEPTENLQNIPESGESSIVASPIPPTSTTDSTQPPLETMENSNITLSTESTQNTPKIEDAV